MLFLNDEPGDDVLAVECTLGYKAHVKQKCVANFSIQSFTDRIKDTEPDGLRLQY